MTTETKHTAGPWAVLQEECDKPYIRVRAALEMAREYASTVAELERALAAAERELDKLHAGLELFDDIFIAPKDMQDDPPNLECMKPLYAHPLALREPTDDECREIADRFLCEVANAARGVRTGRAMFNAVREVMKK